MERITSLQNQRIKNIIRLEKPRERKAQNCFVAEGYREISKAIQSGFTISELYVCYEIGEKEQTDELVNLLHNKAKLFDVSREVFEKMAYREGADGLLAVGVPRYLQLRELQLSANPLILVVEAVEKPGNLGAILRTADAAAIDAVVVCDPHTDLYNPNVIRSSLGCIFTCKVAVCSSSEAIQYFKKNEIQTFAAALTAKKYYHETNLAGSVAIVMGTEADGLSDVWLNGADDQIKIPMCGVADSLNVSTSAAVLVFEAKRQRWAAGEPVICQ
jgi:TrmH family RNA methyltransferase